MYHFYLVTHLATRPMSAPVLPRMGDTICVDGMDITIEKVTWVTSENNTLSDMPMIKGVYADHAVGTSESLAIQIAKQYGDNGARRIAAIKEYRAATNLGLREAKDAMDKAWVDLGWDAVDRSSPF